MEDHHHEVESTRSGSNVTPAQAVGAALREARAPTAEESGDATCRRAPALRFLFTAGPTSIGLVLFASVAAQASASSPQLGHTFSLTRRVGSSPIQ